MRTKSQILPLVAAMIAYGVALPLKLAAQPENSPYVFMSEESGGGGSYLGVDTRNITPEMVGPLHLKEESGVEVTMVDQDAPAGKAGLKEHDVILSINDEKIESEEQLRRVIHEIPAGRTITIGISRNGEPMTLKAQLAERDMDHNFNFNFNTPVVNVPAIHVPPINMPEIDIPTVVVIHSPRNSGIMVENLTPQLGEYFGVKSGNGVLIRTVEKGSRAEQAGFRAGDVIVRVNGSAVNDCSDFSRLLRDRNGAKASVVIIRDHREQTLTLSLPEPRHSGSLESCGYIESVTCAQIVNEGSEVAKLIPEMKTAELKQLQPQMQQLEKQFQQEMQSHSGEIKKEMEQMQQDFRRQEQEMEKQMKEWMKDSEI
ncbi:MAG TPA: PDZ domain-containing protein [Terriglobales bacterium]|nr:PDZ domain-containing protein [Terriglobales bacterium]